MWQCCEIGGDSVNEDNLLIFCFSFCGQQIIIRNLTSSILITKHCHYDRREKKLEVFNNISNT